MASLLACAGITNVSNAFAGVGNPLVVLFDWASGKQKQLLQPKVKFQGTAWGVIFHPAGFLAGVGGGNGGMLWFWKPDASKDFFTLKLPNNARDLRSASRRPASGRGLLRWCRPDVQYGSTGREVMRTDGSKQSRECQRAGHEPLADTRGSDFRIPTPCRQCDDRRRRGTRRSCGSTQIEWASPWRVPRTGWPIASSRLHRLGVLAGALEASVSGNH